MDAVEYLKTLDRMFHCECLKCEFRKVRSGIETCPVWQRTHPEEAVAIVEQWAAEHPVKTRQSEFLKHYPGAQITIDGFLHACPMEVFSDTGINCAAQTCSECRKAFWLAEDEEGELPFLRDQELVNALRCVSTAGGPMGDCKKCPFYKTEPVPENLAGKVNLTEWPSCDVDAVGLAAADRIEAQAKEIDALRNELCLKCGNYTLPMRGPVMDAGGGRRHEA